MSEPYRHLDLRRDGDVLHVTIDRPPVNAVDAVLHAELTRLASDLKGERDARCVLLTGRGRAFSAGGDFAWFPELADPSVREEVRAAGRRIVWDLLDVEVPVVAAVNGPAMGLGATLVLLSDAVFMAESASIGDPHVRVGIVAGDGGTVVWPMILGPLLAKRFLLTGDPIDAEEALRLGLATHVVPADRLDEEASAYAHRLARGAPLAIRYTKLAVNAWMKAVANVTFDLATALEVATMASSDHAEALAALREGREPEFRGR
jgi:enoyl-CoA hydratase